MPKRNNYTPKQLPLAPFELEKAVKLIFLEPGISVEKFAAQSLFLLDGDCEWSLTPYLCHRYRDKNLEEFANHLRTIISDDSVLDELRRKHLSNDEYDDLVKMESETPACTEDYEAELVDTAKLRSAYFSNSEFPEELVWLADYQNKHHGYVGNGVDIRDDESLKDYRIKETHRLFAFAAEADGAPIAIWNAGEDRFPIVYLSMEDPESCFILAENMKEFLAILTLPLIDISNLSSDWLWKDPNEWDVVDKELKHFRRKVKREFNVSKPTNVQTRIKDLQSEFDGFGDWCKEIMTEMDAD